MGIALVCDLPGCGAIIPPDETEAILEKYGDDKPPAIRVEIDGEEEMLLYDVCAAHRDQFRSVLVGFASGAGPAPKPTAVDEPKAEPSPHPKAEAPVGAKTPKRREPVKIPGGIESAVAETRKRAAAASEEIAVAPSDLFGAGEPEEPTAHEAVEEPKPQPKPKAASAGPKPFKRTAERKPDAKASKSPASSRKTGPVVAVLEDEGKETIIEPSFSDRIDFSDTTPAD